jgi:hypothetical protein
MTEAEWLECFDPQKMLHYLNGRATDRQLRLFGCACCRSVWDLITEEHFQKAVEVAERFADDQARKNELTAAKKESGAALERSGKRGITGRSYSALGAAWSSTRTPVGSAAMYPIWVFKTASDRKRQLSLLRDIFANPFHPVTVDSSWRSWNGGAAVRMAQAAYDERQLPSGELDPARLAVLADALEEADCSEAELLDHLRGPGPHVRGCWAVDLLLGKS